MLKVGIIGVGNTGNQISKLAQERLCIPVWAINSSEKDLETVPESIPKTLIRDKEGLSQGAGKDRKRAQQFLKENIKDIISNSDFRNFVNDLDIVYVISSTGGGTGSGTSLIMASILTETFKDVKVISVGVLPVNTEAYSAHVNSLQYLHDLYDVIGNGTYLLYDNDKYAGMSTYKILQKVNEEIVSDIDVMRCTYNKVTPFDSIDDRDMTRLLSFPGRIVICRLEGFSEKDCDSETIEDKLIDNLKRNAHVETQRDKKVMATGLITNMSKFLTDEFDSNVPNVRKFSGDPVHAFTHTYINADRKEPNNVYYIMSGLSPVNDKINLISDRIDEIEEAQRIMMEENALDSLALDQMSEKVADKDEKDTATTVDLGSIFGRFDV